MKIKHLLPTFIAVLFFSCNSQEKIDLPETLAKKILEAINKKSLKELEQLRVSEATYKVIEKDYSVAGTDKSMNYEEFKAYFKKEYKEVFNEIQESESGELTYKGFDYDVDFETDYTALEGEVLVEDKKGTVYSFFLDAIQLDGSDNWELHDISYFGEFEDESDVGELNLKNSESDLKGSDSEFAWDLYAIKTYSNGFSVEEVERYLGQYERKEDYQHPDNPDKTFVILYYPKEIETKKTGRHLQTLTIWTYNNQSLTAYIEAPLSEKETFIAELSGTNDFIKTANNTWSDRRKTTFLLSEYQEDGIIELEIENE